MCVSTAKLPVSLLTASAWQHSVPASHVTPLHQVLCIMAGASLPKVPLSSLQTLLHAGLGANERLACVHT